MMIKIHTEIYGRGEPVVLIHGWSMHSGIWRPFAQQLASHFQVICLDLPGHGRSDSIEPYTLERLSAVLMSVIPVRRFHVLGWSLGATVAIGMACRFPDRIMSLTAIACNPRFVETADWPGVKADVLRLFAKNLSISSKATLIHFLALQVSQLENGKEILKYLKKAVDECKSPSLKVLQDGLKILERSDMTVPLQHIACPVNFILGDKDTLVPRHCSERIRQSFPRVQVHLLKGAGHTPFLSHPQSIIHYLCTTL